MSGLEQYCGPHRVVAHVSVDIRKFTPPLDPTWKERRFLKAVDRALRPRWQKRAPWERPRQPPVRFRRMGLRRRRRRAVTRLRKAVRDGPGEGDHDALIAGGLRIRGGGRRS
jgi:hypothetical protein